MLDGVLVGNTSQTKFVFGPVSPHRDCAPCNHGFSAATQEQADAMYERHLLSSHPEVAAHRELIAKVDELIAALARAQPANPVEGV